MPLRSPIHCNQNLIASVSIMTTGFQPRHNDLFQICVLILTPDLKPSREFKPFYCDIVPRRPKNFKSEEMVIKKEAYLEGLSKSIDGDTAADLFEAWWTKLRLPIGKKIMPMAYDWTVKRDFIEDWLGFHHTRYFFSSDVRDLKVAALYENDKADHQVQRLPFAKVDLQYITATLKISRTRPHNTIQDCLVIPQCFKLMLKQGAHVLTVKESEEINDEPSFERPVEVQDLRLERSIGD